MKLSVQLVTWNGEKYLQELFRSLKRQTFKDWDLLVWDNGSTDASQKMIDELIVDLGVDVKKHYHEKNVGFAPAHTALFNLSNSEYIFTLNQDTELDPDVLEKLASCMSNDPELGSAAPVILRLENGVRTKVVDSLGLEFKKSREVVDLDAGKNFLESISEFSPSQEVFGVTAAAAIYSRSAVKNVSKAGELFDLSFISYQEDIDLAWRLRLGGFGSIVLHDAFVYHNRSVRAKSLTVRDKIQAKKNQPLFVRKQSYKNHLLTIIKNEQWQNFILDFVFIFWYEGMKLIYNAVFDREVLVALKELWIDKNSILAERERVKNINKESWRNIGRWFV